MAHLPELACDSMLAPRSNAKLRVESRAGKEIMSVTVRRDRLERARSGARVEDAVLPQQDVEEVVVVVLFVSTRVASSCECTLPHIVLVLFRCLGLIIHPGSDAATSEARCETQAC